MKPYTQSFLKKEERQQNNNDFKEGEIMEMPSDYYKYSLNGVVIHMGTTDSGFQI